MNWIYYTSGAKVFAPQGGCPSNPGDPIQSRASIGWETNRSGFFLDSVHQGLSRWPQPVVMCKSFIFYYFSLIWTSLKYLFKNYMNIEEIWANLPMLWDYVDRPNFLLKSQDEKNNFNVSRTARVLVLSFKKSVT